jgi:hypothetical protein
MIRGYAGFLTGRAAIDNTPASLSAVVTSTHPLDSIGRAILAAGQTLTVGTDRASSVVVITDLGCWWVDSGAGPCQHTTARRAAVQAVHVQPPMTTAQKDAFLTAMHPDESVVPVTELSDVYWDDGYNFWAHNPMYPTSLQRSTQRRCGYRFEIVPGPTSQRQRDLQAGNTNQRSELHSRASFPFDTDVWVSMEMLIEPGPNLEAGTWAILGQIVGADDPGEAGRQGNWRQTLWDNGRLAVQTQSDPVAITVTSPPPIERYSIPNFPRGTWQRLVYRLVFSRSGGGHVQWWHNGAQVYDADVPMGANDTLGPQLKFGIYKKVSAVDAMVVRYRNVEAGTASLFDRIANPLPVA